MELNLGDKVKYNKYYKKLNGFIIQHDNNTYTYMALGKAIKDANGCGETYPTWEIRDIKEQCGVFVGVKDLATSIEMDNDENDNIFFRKNDYKKVAIVYFANNKKQYVPLENIIKE